MWSSYDHGWGWGMGFRSISMALFWALVIAGIVVLVRWIAAGTGGSAAVPPPGKSAFDILKERYARGEIEREEFEQKKREIDP